ncbi:MAG: hypothetical protein AMJ78_00675 [Omnitrophica WOR_2 bacterium SM23_29]|nr:MAG: hypothetical protein AMJ78_00675 [Omnitrophica WOR_2 bacterium SM23_29]
MSELKFGDKIRELRKRIRLSQEQLAERAGIEVTYLSKLECNKTKSRPNEKTIESLANALNLSEEEKNDLFFLASRIPSFYGEIIMEKKGAPEILRAVKDLDEEEILKLIEEIKKKKSK